MAESRRLIFQDDVGQGLLGGVGDREGDILRAEPGGDGRRLAVKLNRGTLASWAHDFDIAPADAATPSRAQRLHPGFLGGKARSIAFKAAGFSFALADFAFGEDAAEEAVSEALDAFANARNFGDVHSGAENHRSIVNWYFVICNLGVGLCGDGALLSPVGPDLQLRATFFIKVPLRPRFASLIHKEELGLFCGI